VCLASTACFLDGSHGLPGNLLECGKEAAWQAGRAAHITKVVILVHLGAGGGVLVSVSDSSRGLAAVRPLQAAWQSENAHPPRGWRSARSCASRRGRAPCCATRAARAPAARALAPARPREPKQRAASWQELPPLSCAGLWQSPPGSRCHPGHAWWQLAKLWRAARQINHTGKQSPLTTHMQTTTHHGGSCSGRHMLTQSAQSRQPQGARSLSTSATVHDSAAAHPRAAPAGSPHSAQTRRPAAAAWQAAQQRCRWVRCALLPWAQGPPRPPAPWLRAPARRAAAAAAAAAAAQGARPRRGRCRRRARGPGAWRAWLRPPAPRPARAQPGSGSPPAAACAAAGHCS